jgi:hypothetical protein
MVKQPNEVPTIAAASQADGDRSRPPATIQVISTSPTPDSADHNRAAPSPAPKTTYVAAVSQ